MATIGRVAPWATNNREFDWLCHAKHEPNQRIKTRTKRREFTRAPGGYVALCTQSLCVSSRVKVTQQQPGQIQSQCSQTLLPACVLLCEQPYTCTTTATMRDSSLFIRFFFSMSSTISSTRIPCNPTLPSAPLCKHGVVNGRWNHPHLVHPLAHRLFGLAANLIANSYGWKRFLKKYGLVQLWLDRGLRKYGLAQLVIS